MPRHNQNLKQPQERDLARNQNFASENVASRRCLEDACEQAKEQRDQLLESSRQVQNALRENQVTLANFEKLMKDLQANNHVGYAEKVALKRCLEKAYDQAKEQRDQLLERSRQIQNALRENQIALSNFEKLLKELNYIRNVEPKRVVRAVPKMAERAQQKRPERAQQERMAPAPWQEYEARERKITADANRKNYRARG